MTLPRITPFLIALALILLLALPGATAAQHSAPDMPPEQPPPVEAAPPSPDAGPQKAADGHWFMPAGSRSDAASAAAPQDSGGPDDFGYTWNDWEPLNWINASGGTDTGINSGTVTWGRSTSVSRSSSTKMYAPNCTSRASASWRSTAITWGTANPKSPAQKSLMR